MVTLIAYHISLIFCNYDQIRKLVQIFSMVMSQYCRTQRSGLFLLPFTYLDTVGKP